MRMTGHGLEIDLPSAWEARLYRRPGGHPILHAGDFALPANDSDFGTRAMVAMGGGGVLVVLAEYDPILVGTGLFSAAGMPLPLAPDDVHPRALHRTLPGRAGAQRFFSESGRAFCLYVVVGTATGTAAPIARANLVLATVRISPHVSAPEPAA